MSAVAQAASNAAMTAGRANLFVGKTLSPCESMALKFSRRRLALAREPTERIEDDSVIYSTGQELKQRTGAGRVIGSPKRVCALWPKCGGCSRRKEQGRVPRVRAEIAAVELGQRILSGDDS